MRVNKLKELRLKNGLTQENIAEFLHLSQNAYSLIENGKTRLIDIERINIISQQFSVSPWELGLFDELLHFNPEKKEVMQNDESVNSGSNDNEEFINTLQAEIKIKNTQLEKAAIQIDQLLNLLSAKK